MADDRRREAKRALRRECFSRVKAMTGAEKAAASERIRTVIAAEPLFQEAGQVAAYVALGSEPDLDPLILAFLDRKRWCLPRVNQEDCVEMRGITDFSELVTGEFGIGEPNPDTCRAAAGAEIDLVLIPGVGFDPANRARLGRGKGHYDRFLARLRELPAPPPVWGVCFSAQRVPIDPEPHDQPVDAIVTEQGIISREAVARAAGNWPSGPAGRSP